MPKEPDPQPRPGAATGGGGGAGQPGEPVTIATLGRVGRRTINYAYLIMAENLNDPDPDPSGDASEALLTEVTLETGKSFFLRGKEAAEFNRQLERFVPREPVSSTLAGRTQLGISPAVRPARKAVDQDK